MSNNKAKIKELIVAKAFLDIAIVTLVLAWNGYNSTAPAIRGGFDAGADVVTGWAVNPARPQEIAAVTVFIDGKLVYSGPADKPRPDVVAAGFSARENCGFAVELPRLDAGTHRAVAYAVLPARNGSPVFAMIGELTLETNK